MCVLALVKEVWSVSLLVCFTEGDLTLVRVNSCEMGVATVFTPIVIKRATELHIHVCISYSKIY